MGSAGGKGSKGGSSGQASPAALYEDSDPMLRRKVVFEAWKSKRKKNQMIDYAQSPPPPPKTMK